MTANRLLARAVLAAALSAAASCSSPAPKAAVAELEAAANLDGEPYGIYREEADGHRTYRDGWSDCFFPLSQAPASVRALTYSQVASKLVGLCDGCWDGSDIPCGSGRVVGLVYLGPGFHYESGEWWWFDAAGSLVGYSKPGLGSIAGCPHVFYGSVHHYCNPFDSINSDTWYYADTMCGPPDSAFPAQAVCDVTATTAADSGDP
ncbi:MAG: hypothetical protein HY902_12905 [Deltaproteobacteria bacterium]|nr:hypothetical protein [Deltaproteobacteria bacterium]